jgi:hypothetical protein
MTDDELKDLVASLAIDQKELTKKMAQTDEQMRRTDEQINRLETQVEKMARKIDRVGKIVGNVGKNQGAVTEEFFFNSLGENAHLGGIHFDNLMANIQMRQGKLEEEYDIVMMNGNAVGIVEVKYKAHEKDVNKLERKMTHFKKLFPVYKNFKLYGAIASFHFYDKAKQTALENGFFVLQRSGNVIQTDCGQNLRVM